MVARDNRKRFYPSVLISRGLFWLWFTTWIYSICDYLGSGAREAFSFSPLFIRVPFSQGSMLAFSIWNFLALSFFFIFGYDLPKKQGEDEGYYDYAWLALVFFVIIALFFLLGAARITADFGFGGLS